MRYSRTTCERIQYSPRRIRTIIRTNTQDTNVSEDLAASIYTVSQPRRPPLEPSPPWKQHQEHVSFRRDEALTNFLPQTQDLYCTSILTLCQLRLIRSGDSDTLKACDNGSIHIYEGVSKSFRTESITKLTTINTRWEVTQRVKAANSLDWLTKYRYNYIQWQRAVPFAVLSPGGQSGNFWIHQCPLSDISYTRHFWNCFYSCPDVRVAMKSTEWFYCKRTYLCNFSLLRGVTLEVLLLSSYALSPTMLPLLGTFMESLLGVRVPAEAGNFPLRYRVQTASGAHAACYPMCTEFFPRG
jgi:hypothetical protein